MIFSRRSQPRRCIKRRDGHSGTEEYTNLATDKNQLLVPINEELTLFHKRLLRRIQSACQRTSTNPGNHAHLP